jgi:hypothetical protein
MDQDFHKRKMVVLGVIRMNLGELGCNLVREHGSPEKVRKAWSKMVMGIRKRLMEVGLGLRRKILVGYELERLRCSRTGFLHGFLRIHQSLDLFRILLSLVPYRIRLLHHRCSIHHHHRLLPYRMSRS